MYIFKYILIYIICINMCRGDPQICEMKESLFLNNFLHLNKIIQSINYFFLNRRKQIEFFFLWLQIPVLKLIVGGIRSSVVFPTLRIWIPFVQVSLYLFLSLSWMSDGSIHRLVETWNLDCAFCVWRVRHIRKGFPESALF